jgi:hypothetical protein
VGSRDVEKSRKHSRRRLPVVPVKPWSREDLADRSVCAGAVLAVGLWGDVHWDVLGQRHLDVVRKAGALSLLPLSLAIRAIFGIHSGDLLRVAHRAPSTT